MENDNYVPVIGIISIIMGIYMLNIILIIGGIILCNSESVASATRKKDAKAQQLR